MVQAKSQKGGPNDRETFEESFLVEGRDVLSSGPSEYLVSIPIILNELGLVKSTSEARRLIKQGAIQIIHKDGSRRTVSENRDFIEIGDNIVGEVVKVGKRRWVRIVNSEDA